MCPFCIASMGLAVAGAVSGSGLAALAVKVSRKTNGAQTKLHERSNDDVNEQDREPENRVAR
jgi:hypothetical protein